MRPWKPYQLYESELMPRRSVSLHRISVEAWQAIILQVAEVELSVPEDALAYRFLLRVMAKANEYVMMNCF
jgi:hypothetical protein